MGFFSRLFFAEHKDLADLSQLKCDIHSHFIPGIDDGAKDLEDSIKLIRGMAELGYKKLITTPHIMGDFYQNSPATIQPGLDRVREAIITEKIDIKIEAAAEYYIDADFDSKIEKGKLMTFGNNYVLFEISYLNAPDSLSEAIFKLQTSGYIPVLAHPERYPFWYSDFEKYEELKDKSVLFQLNINSLTGHYSPGTKKIAELMIDKGMIDFLGSDCHHSGHLELMNKARASRHLHKLLASGNLLNSQL